MSALCGRVECQWRECSTQGALLSGMNYRCFFDSWCRLCGKYRLCQVNFEKASIFGQRQSAWPFWEQPQFLLFHLFFVLSFSISFLSLFFSPISYFLSSSPSASSPLSVCCGWHARPWQHRLANRDRHCLSTYPTDEAAFPFLLEYLYKFIGGCLY